METNVVEHDTVIWRRAKSADENITKREGDLFAEWQTLGRCLMQLRERYKADQQFGQACLDHGIDRTHRHIGAAIWLATLNETQLATLQEEFPEALHPKTLRDKCAQYYPQWSIGTRSAVGRPSGATESQGPTFEEKPAEQPESSAETQTAVVENAVFSTPEEQPTLPPAVPLEVLIE